VGNILDFERLEDIWQSPAAVKLQKTILDKTYDWCAIKHCGIEHFDIRMSRYEMGINVDESCNLACPSCRKSAVNHTSGTEYQTRLSYATHIVDLLNLFDQPIQITMSGNGDPLASTALRPILLNWQPRQNQTIKLHTNGLLMKKLLPTSTVFEHISNYMISVDAASDAVYSQVRRPARFAQLLENLTWLKQHKPPHSQVVVSFVVQRANVVDIESFADLCGDLGFVAEYTKLDNWSTFDDFSREDVAQPQHALHHNMMQSLNRVKLHPHVRIAGFLRNLM
jgi:MoaA/NifB/PqqE/SkfB family radical SAM enzyme